ncbi:STAS domain-containing protein [Saccharothrix sp. NRRL B-16314]|uniref:STAS domain-containing protein n=1 Tax=Saccharothrix sp. NRRL B-16314 TaxID=1463825 RepID=UPI00052571C7|nr:STAS domain-containing protein [Saccharothrix sp. NRRL B-16314]
METTRAHDHDGVAVVEVIGEVDMASDAAVRALIAAQLDRRPAGLVVDLSRTDFFGSAGIQLLVEAVLRTQVEGVGFAVVTDRRAVLHPLRVTLVDEAVDVHPTLEDALTALRAEHRPARSMAHQ